MKVIHYFIYCFKLERHKHKESKTTNCVDNQYDLMSYLADIIMKIDHQIKDHQIQTEKLLEE